MSDPRERYDHNANNVTGTPVDEENDLVPIQLWREQQAEIERLQSIINAKLHQRRCHDCGHVAWYADSRTPYCLCDRCCSWLCDRCRSWDTRRVKGG